MTQVTDLFRGARVTTGFLTGNLFANIAREKLARIDLEASIRKYAELLETTLQNEFPGAHIEVRYEEGEGPVPRHLQSHVQLASCADVPTAECSGDYIDGFHDDIKRQYDWIIAR